MSWNILRQNKQLLGLTIAGSLTVLTAAAAFLATNESDKDTASDGAANDDIGGRVSIDGDTAVVGAKFNDDGGTDSGSAYIFEQGSIDPDEWTETTKITADDDAAGDLFGRAVYISGDIAVVGALGDDHGGMTNAGSAYIFSRSQGGTDNWGQVAKLTASDAAANDQFGGAVAIDGTAVIIGAAKDDHSSKTDAGSAYIFRQSSSGWSQEAKITASDPEHDNHFGFAVAILGNRALIGTPLDNDCLLYTSPSPRDS